MRSASKQMSTKIHSPFYLFAIHVVHCDIVPGNIAYRRSLFSIDCCCGVSGGHALSVANVKPGGWQATILIWKAKRKY